jgi:hypothetical protein
VLLLFPPVGTASADVILSGRSAVGLLLLLLLLLQLLILILKPTRLVEETVAADGAMGVAIVRLELMLILPPARATEGGVGLDGRAGSRGCWH